MKKILSLMIGACLFLAGTNALAATIYVNSGESIQTALNSANAGDTVTVKQGTYYENIVWPSVNDITLDSETGADVTILDGSSSPESVIAIDDGQTGFKIIGLTIQNGDYSDGAGIYIGAAISSSPIKSSNSLTTTDASVSENIGLLYDVEGLYDTYGVEASKFAVTDKTAVVKSNSLITGYFASIAEVIEDCKIINNVGPGIQVGNGVAVAITNNFIDGNEGVGIACYSAGSGTTINDNTISNNRTQETYSQSGICVYATSGVTMSNNIVKANHAVGIWIQANSSAIIFNNIVEDNEKDGIFINGNDFSYNTTASVKNNTVVENGGYGGLGYRYVPSITIKSNVLIANNGGDIRSYGINGDSGLLNPNITHNNSYGHDNDNYYNCYTMEGMDNNISQDPSFTGDPISCYYLSQTTSGQASNSPCLDSGSDTAASLGLDTLTTRTDGIVDSGTADMGYHYANGLEVPLLPFIAADLNGNGMDEVVVDFGDTYGIWIRYDDGTWTKLHNTSPESIVKGNFDGDVNNKDDLAIDFGDAIGIVVCYNDGESWQNLNSLNPDSIAVGDLSGDARDELVIDFGDIYGLWIYSPETTGWTQIHNLSPESVAIGDIDGGGNDIIMDYGDTYGLWVRNNSGSWTQLHNLSPESVVIGDIDGGGDDLILDYGDTYGLWARYNNSTWTQLHNASPEAITTGNIDGNGDDVIMDFGDTYGLWARYDDGSWAQIHNLNPEWVITGDLDGSGDDIIIDFGDAYGLWSRYEDSGWEQLHNMSP